MLNDFQRFAGGIGHDFIQAGLEPQNLAGLNLNIRSLALRAAQRLVHVDGGVGKRITLAFCTCGQEHGAKRCGYTNGHGADLVRDHLHSVVDGQPGIDLSARRIDVHLDGAFRIFLAQVEQLGYGHVGDLIVNGCSKEDDAFLEQQGINIIGAFTPSGGFNNHRDDRFDFGNGHKPS